MVQNVNEDPLQLNSWLLGLMYCFLFLLIIIVKHQVVISDYQLETEYVGSDFENYLSVTNTFRLLKYLFLTIGFSFSIFINAIILSGLNFYYNSNMSKTELINLAIFSSSAILLREITIITYFIFREDFISTEVFNFDPFSVYSLLGWQKEDIKYSLVILTQSIDIFLLIKGMIIFWGIKKLSDLDLRKQLLIAFTFFIPYLIFWIFLHLLI